MTEQEKLDQLQAMANNPNDSLKKFMAKEILTHDNPLNFFALVKKFGLETLYHYEDLEDEQIEEFYITYSKEIEEIQQENKVQHQTEKDRSWFALEKTTEKISKDLEGNLLLFHLL